MRTQDYNSIMFCCETYPHFLFLFQTKKQSKHKQHEFGQESKDSPKSDVEETEIAEKLSDDEACSVGVTENENAELDSNINCENQPKAPLKETIMGILNVNHEMVRVNYSTFIILWTCL